MKIRRYEFGDMDSTCMDGVLTNVKLSGHLRNVHLVVRCCFAVGVGCNILFLDLYLIRSINSSRHKAFVYFLKIKNKA